MKILITGITGRIGSNVAVRLVEQGHEVRGLVWPNDRRVEKLSGYNIDLREGSLTEWEDVRNVVDGVEAVYHFGAAFQGGGPFADTDYFEINVKGTFYMLKAARELSEVQHFLFASTDAIYDKYPPDGMAEPIDQDTVPTRPAGWYSMSKAIGEELCNGYWHTHHLPITILRFCLVVGAGEILDFQQFYMSHLSGRAGFENLAKSDRRLVVLKDANGRVYKKHIADVRDIVQGCAAVLGKPAAFGHAFQLAGPRPFTWDEAVPYLSERLGVPYEAVSVPGTPTYYEYDLSKPRSKFGFQPQYDIIRMIDDAVAFREGGDIAVLPT